MFVHVNEHDKAYRWAAGRRVKLDPETNRVRIIEEVKVVPELVATTVVAAPHLFEGVPNARLRTLGVPEEELAAVYLVPTIDDLEAVEDRFDPLTYQILYAVAAGYEDEEIRSLTGIGGEAEAEAQVPATELTFGQMIERAGPQSPALYLSNGLYDAFGNFEGTQALAQRARARGVQTEWHPLYGGHCALDAPSVAAFLVA